MRSPPVIVTTNYLAAIPFLYFADGGSNDRFSCTNRGSVQSLCVDSKTASAT